MQTEKLPPPIWIATPGAIKELADELAGWTRIAVDTESNSMHAFREQLCLIQFSTPQTDYLVDPLALKDLSPLRPVFANPEIEKVFHAAEYDLICLKRDSGITVANSRLMVDLCTSTTCAIAFRLCPIPFKAEIWYLCSWAS